jgi:hypothetical protein
MKRRPELLLVPLVVVATWLWLETSGPRGTPQMPEPEAVSSPELDPSLLSGPSGSDTTPPTADRTDLPDPGKRVRNWRRPRTSARSPRPRASSSTCHARADPQALVGRANATTGPTRTAGSTPATRSTNSRIWSSSTSGRPGMPGPARAPDEARKRLARAALDRPTGCASSGARTWSDANGSRLQRQRCRGQVLFLRARPTCATTLLSRQGRVPGRDAQQGRGLPGSG